MKASFSKRVLGGDCGLSSQSPSPHTGAEVSEGASKTECPGASRAQSPPSGAHRAPGQDWETSGKLDIQSEDCNNLLISNRIDPCAFVPATLLLSAALVVPARLFLKFVLPEADVAIRSQEPEQRSVVRLSNF